MSSDGGLGGFGFFGESGQIGIGIDSHACFHSRQGWNFCSGEGNCFILFIWEACARKEERGSACSLKFGDVVVRNGN